MITSRLYKWITKLFFVLLCVLMLRFSSISTTTARAVSPSFTSDGSFLSVCDPTITFTDVPPFGSFNNLRGRVDCAAPANFKVAVYIYVCGWWIKPYYDSLTTVGVDGTWETNITTGGADQLATRIAVFLLPNGTNPINLKGDSTIPQTVFANSVAHNIIDRYRTIQFSGYIWNVKSCEVAKVGPGPNYFSAQENDIWVDATGNLHLTIKYRNGNWYSTEVFTQAPLGYGTYTFAPASRIDQLDKNAVLGLFTWDETAPEHCYREIDIEFSRWGQASNKNSQYVVEPLCHPENMLRFETTLGGLFSTHSFKWDGDHNHIFFSSYQGHEPNLGNKIANWLYTGAHIPPAGSGNARINLWLINGVPPSNGQGIEVVIKAFRYSTLPLWSCSKNDFDKDGRIDLAKFYSNTGTVWWLRSSTGTWDGGWLGPDSFIYICGSDFDGDGKTDLAKFYPDTGTIWWLQSSTGTWEGRWLGPDIFDYVAGSDFDGDGKTDPAKFYSSTGTVWWLRSSTGTWDGRYLGTDTFTYVSSSDFDGDGKTDPAKFYPSTGVIWWLRSSTGTWDGKFLGSDSFTYVPGSDFDGDGKTDPAKFYASNGTVWWLRSSTETWDGRWLGPDSFTYVPGSDFDGDGKTDPAKFYSSNGTVWWLRSSDGTWDGRYLGSDSYLLVN